MKRLLFISEAGHTFSGFGKYYRQLLARLHSTNKYVIGELASYAEATQKEARLASYVSWKYYPNAVSADDPRYQEYLSRPENVFGAWRFERACLDFKPDVVIDMRDPWFFQWESISPLREYFHWCICPTVDSAPQQEQWIAMFQGADSVLAYTQWGLDVLNAQSNGKINTVCEVPIGVDFDVFKPTSDKAALRAKMGLPEDAFIIGTVMRNQPRKLFPDLIKAFKLFIQRCKQEGNDSLAARSYLYMHTSWPDNGYNLPEIIKNSGISHKIIMTYYCREKKRWFVSNCQDARTFSPFSRKPTAMLPYVAAGLDEAQLADVYNLFDVYIQYAIAEGQGVPQVEAAACGIPVMSVDATAMSDVVRKLDGVPLKVGRVYREAMTGADRVHPDNEYLAAQLYDFSLLNTSKRAELSRLMVENCHRYYDWDVIALKWQFHLDNIQLKDKQGMWDAPMNTFNGEFNPHPDLNPTSLMDYLYTKGINRPDMIGSYEYLRFVRDIHYGCQITGKKDGSKISNIKPQDIINLFKQINANKNHIEQARCGKIPLPKEDWIEFAEIMEGSAK